MFAGLLNWPCVAPERSCGNDLVLQDVSCSTLEVCSTDRAAPPLPADAPCGTLQVSPTDRPIPPLLSEYHKPAASKMLKNVPRLTVPSTFNRFQFSVIYTQLGETQGTLMEQQRTMLQAILKHFAKELTAGVAFAVVDSDGRSLEYVCRLDRKMTRLVMNSEDPKAAKVSAFMRSSLEEPKVTKAISFKDIEQICSPEEVRNLRTTDPLFIDECCTMLVLTNNRFVTFRLESVTAREYVMLCLQVLRMSQKQARMWYTPRAAADAC